MTRLYTCGFEQNTLALGGEISTRGGIETIVTSPVFAGSYSLRSMTAAGATAAITASYGARSVAFLRGYMYIGTVPDVTMNVFGVQDEPGNQTFQIQLTTGTALRMRDGLTGGTAIGTSAALSLNTWYRLELGYNMTAIASSKGTAFVNGTAFANGTFNLTGEAFMDQLQITDQNQGAGTWDIYFDDLAVNDSLGIWNNSYPGTSLHLRQPI